MNINPFASFNVEIPKKYQDNVKKYCRTGNNESSPEFSPFDRQVDFWFMAFLIAVNKKLDPVKEQDVYNATTGAIFSSDPKRVVYMQICILGITKDFDLIANNREVFTHCIRLANAGMPHLIQILKDPDDRPLWALLDELEDLSI